MSEVTTSPIVRMAAAARPVHLTIVSTSPPQRCGIASYSTDIVHALAEVAPTWKVDVCALDSDGAHYSDPVSVVVAEDDRSDYARAADELTARGTELVLVQHEYGIFGGDDGEYLVDFTDRLTERGVPYVITLHTVLSHPSVNQTKVLRALCANAALVTVFTETARRVIIDEDIVDPEHIVVAEHGAPAVLRASVDQLSVGASVADTLAQLRGSTVLCTFGLLGPSKGIEVAITALPAVVERHPDVVYLIAGATHPGVTKHEGEHYRESLVALAANLGVSAHVRFLDAFFSDDEVAAILAATTVYLTPYLGAEQSSSGTLTFAVTAGIPVVSSRYRYAVDLLAAQPGGVPSGILVEPGHPAELAAAIGRLLDDPREYLATKNAADARGATLTWPAVAGTLVQTLLPIARSRRAVRARASRLNLDHLARLAEQDGITQFARLSEPARNSGYCVDDVARLGIVAASVCRRGGRDGTLARDWLVLTERFLSESRGLTALTESRDLGALTESRAPGAPTESRDPGAPTRGLRNMRDRRGHWLDEPHQGDHVGRSIWALGVMSAAHVPTPLRRRAQDMLRDFLPLANDSHDLRSAAFAILGLSQTDSPEARRVLAHLAERLDSALQGGTAEWRWFEDTLTYDNARLPQALLTAGIALDDRAMVDRALRSLDWYLAEVGLAGEQPQLRLVGNNWLSAAELAQGTSPGTSTATASITETGAGTESGTGTGAGTGAGIGTETGTGTGTGAGTETGTGTGTGTGDEQPLDAAAIVEALVAAWRHTKSPRYAALARRAFGWFTGDNRAGVPLYDPHTGGCRDGLHTSRANANMGAESTLAYYQALFALVEAGLLALPEAPGQQAHYRAHAQSARPHRVTGT